MAKITHDNIYKFMFLKDGDGYVKCCKVTAVTDDTIFFDEPSPDGEYLKRKSIEADSLEKVVNGGKFKVVYLDEFEPDKARDIIVGYYNDRVEELTRKIEECNLVIMNLVKAYNDSMKEV